MPRFQYTAYDKRGKLVSGDVDAASRQAALDALHASGTMPLDISQIEHGRALETSAWYRTVNRRTVGRDVIMLLVRELSTLLAAEVTLEDALRITALQPAMPAAARRLVADILERVLSGAALSQALAAHSSDFPEDIVRLVAAGERSGTVGSTLTTLADELERSARLSSDIRSALLYPLTLVVAAVATLSVVIAVLVPAIMPLFEETGAKPPPALAALNAFRGFLADFWPLILASGGGALALATLQAGGAGGRSHLLGRILLRIPVVGRLLQRRETCRFAGTAGLMLHHGVPPLDAVRLAGRATMLAPFRTAAEEFERDLENGGLLSTSIARSGLFSPLAERMVIVGERTGRLDTMLQRLSWIEGEALQRDFQRLVTLVAPVLTIVVGLLVGGILLSVMSAIVGLNDLALR